MDSVVPFLLTAGYGVLTLAPEALGLAVIFGLLGVVNMAHGAFVAIGACCAVAGRAADLPFSLALPLAALVTGGIGWVIEIGIIRHLRTRPFDTPLATRGLSILLREIIKLAFGQKCRSAPEPASGGVALLGGGAPGRSHRGDGGAARPDPQVRSRPQNPRHDRRSRVGRACSTIGGTAGCLTVPIIQLLFLRLEPAGVHARR